MKKKVIRGRGLIPGKARGFILKIEKPISPLGDIDPVKGELILNGKRVALKNKALFLPYTIGSTVGAYVFYRLRKNSLVPVAIVAEKADITLVTACTISRIPLVDRVKIKDIDGKFAEIDGKDGYIIIY